jgi:hypothetical protein
MIADEHGLLQGHISCSFCNLQRWQSEGLYKGVLVPTLLVWTFGISWSSSSISFFVLLYAIWWFFVTHGVGPSIAISFSVYETLQYYWLLERQVVHDKILATFMQLRVNFDCINLRFNTGHMIPLSWLVWLVDVFRELHHQLISAL